MSAYHELAGTYDDRFHGGYRERIQDGIISRVLNELIPNGCNKILDAGGGTGFYSLPLAKMGHSVTILDVSREMLEVAQKKAEMMGLTDRVRIVQGDMEEIAFESSEFDLVLCHLALCHTREPIRAVREFHRVLKNGGLLSLMVENSVFFSLVEAFRGNLKLALERLKMKELYIDFNGLGRLRTFGREEVLSMLDEVGFEPIRVMGLRVLSDYLMYSKNYEQQDLESLKSSEELLGENNLVNTVGRFHFIVSRSSAQCTSS